MNESNFRSIAKKEIVNYWNSNKTLVKKFGEINVKKVYSVWESKVLANRKALMGVNVQGDGMYFEFTWNGEDHEGYLDIYKLQKQLVVEK